MRNGKSFLSTITIVLLSTLAVMAQNPQVSVDPESFLVTLLEGEQTTRTLTITNSGDAELAYEIWLHNPDPASENALIAVSTSPYNDENLQLENTLTDLGYSYVFVNSVGEALAANADAIMGRFGGAILDPVELESWVLSGHGYLHLGDWSSWLAVASQATGGEAITIDIVDPNSPLAIDLPSSWSATGFWHYQGSQRLGWMTDATYGNVGDATVLSETHQRAITLKRLGNGYVSFLGFNVYGEAAPAASLQLFANALDWITTGAWSSWLSLTPTEGTVPSGEFREVELLLDAAGLGGGSYELEVMVSSNDPASPLLTVPVTLQVTGSPVLTSDPTELEFGTCYIDSTVTRQLDVANVGTDLLLVTEIQATPPWQGGHLPFSLMPGEHEILTVVFAPTTSADYNGSLTLLSNDPVQPVYLVPLHGVAMIPPIIGIDPASVYTELYRENFGEELLTVTNQGEADLEVIMLLHNLIPTYSPGPSGDELSELIHSQLPGFNSQPPAWAQTPNPIGNPPPVDSRNITIAVTQSNFLVENNQLEYTLAELGYSHVYITEVEEAAEAGALAILGRFGGVDLNLDDLTAWIESGHGYIQIGDWIDWYPDNWTHLGGAEVVVELQDSGHPLASGLPASWIADGYWEYSRGEFLGWVTSSAFHDVADATAAATTYERVVTADQVGEGFAVYLGFNVYGENACAESKQLLENALQWVITGDVVTWVRPVPNTLSLPGGEEFDVALEFDSHGLNVGDYFAILTLLTNDPSLPELEALINMRVLPDEDCQPCFSLQELSCGQPVTGNTNQLCNISAWDQYGCAPETEMGPELVYHINIPDYRELIVNWESEGLLHLFLLTECDPQACIAVGDGGLLYYDCLAPGDYYLALDGPLPEGVAFDLIVNCNQCLTLVEPSVYSLDENYPNPFNPVTSIGFNLAEPGMTTLSVFNLQGQLVATLIERPLPAGSHRVQFDGSSLSSGLYFYTLNAGEFTATRKMVLIK